MCSFFLAFFNANFTLHGGMVHDKMSVRKPEETGFSLTNVEYSKGKAWYFRNEKEKNCNCAGT